MKSKKGITVIVFVVVVVAGATAAAIFQGQSQKGADREVQERATVIQEGQMTDKQREHSKRYKGFGNGKKLKDLAVEVPGGVKVKRNTPLPVGELGPSPNFSEFLKGLTCNADAVVIGVVKDKSSQLTEDGEFVFTDYELSIEDVLKDNEFAHLVPNISLTLTQPGGKVQLGGHIIEAEDASFKSLVIGERYALFLKFIPSTGAYASLNSTSTYELHDNKIKVQTEEAIRSELNNEKASTLIENVRTVATGGCTSKRAPE